MTNQTSPRRVNLIRLLMIWLSLGMCFTIAYVLLAVPLNADTVAFCFDSFDFFGGDYDILADCLDYAVSEVREPRPTDTPGEPPTPTFTPSPTATPNPDAPPPADTPTPTPNPDGTPAIINSQCLSKRQLMIVFEFRQPITGEYELFVNGEPYQIAPVPDRPDRLFFFGAAPPGGGMPAILMQSVPDGAVVLKVTNYSVPQCDFQSPNQPGPGGGSDYVPPP